MAVISLTDVGRRYGQHQALVDVTTDIGSPSITGLLGRNGAGKSTLLRILAGQEFATSGRVAVFGATPAENDAVLRRMILIREVTWHAMRSLAALSDIGASLNIGVPTDIEPSYEARNHDQSSNGSSISSPSRKASSRAGSWPG